MEIEARYGNKDNVPLIILGLVFVVVGIWIIIYPQTPFRFLPDIIKQFAGLCAVGIGVYVGFWGPMKSFLIRTPIVEISAQSIIDHRKSASPIDYKHIKELHFLNGYGGTHYAAIVFDNPQGQHQHIDSLLEVGLQHDPDSLPLLERLHHSIHLNDLDHDPELLFDAILQNWKAATT